MNEGFVLLSPTPMHAPDGFFAPWLSIVGWIVTVAMVLLAIRNTRTQLGERQIPLMGLIAAAIFAGQMLNFTIPGGTSGHLLGGALAAILLGPWGGVLVMTTVVGIQGLLFQDGGLVVMGINIINMGIVTSFSGYFVYQLLKRRLKGNTGTLVGGFVAGWVSVVLTSLFASVELALSGTSPLIVALPAMVGVHVMIGVGEGLLTAFALSFILAARRDLVTGDTAPGQRSAAWVLVGLVVALAITLLAPLASPYSDGLERVAEVLSAPGDVEIPPVGFQPPGSPQFIGEAQASPYEILPDYTIPFLGESGLSTILAGMVGVLVVFGAAYGVALVNRRVTRRRELASASTPE
ncbi:MAG: energy-coupling factor ABC transporter permease [Anaerolineae bacterium]|nr:energy-coupling factor ABC transporter permease [Anaerolineae bacterium]